MLKSRFDYFYTKLQHAWADGTFRERVTRKLKSSAATNVGALTNYVALSADDKKLSLAEGFAERRENIDEKRENEIVGRIIGAYQKAKKDFENAAPQFQIRGLWAEWIAVNYGNLLAAINANDAARAAGILQNFAREQFAVGTGSSYDDLVHYKTSLTGAAYVKTVWCDYRDKLIDAGFDLNQITHPNIGNPAGFRIGAQLIPTETLRHAYNAFAINNLLRGVKNANVVEIGGGFGGQAYQTIYQARQSGNQLQKYLDFDIPEVGIVVSYFLLRAFPDLQIRLYGEAEIADENFDIGIFPHFTIDRLAGDSIDLLFNSNSFSEMDAAASTHYLTVVNRVCRRYFMHINHETPLVFNYPDGTTSRNAPGSALIPNTAAFKRIYKRPRLFERPEDKPFKSFAYLYERITP